jgi:hypothetical protein
MRRSVRTKDLAISLAAILQGINSLVDSGSDLSMVPSDAEHVRRSWNTQEGILSVSQYAAPSIEPPLPSIHFACRLLTQRHTPAGALEWSEYEFGKLLWMIRTALVRRGNEANGSFNSQSTSYVRLSAVGEAGGKRLGSNNCNTTPGPISGE